MIKRIGLEALEHKYAERWMELGAWEHKYAIKCLGLKAWEDQDAIRYLGLEAWERKSAIQFLGLQAWEHIICGTGSLGTKLCHKIRRSRSLAARMYK